MARGLTLNQMVLDLRAELRRSQSPAVGVEDLPTLKRALNHVQRIVYFQRDWTFLKTRPTIPLAAGQRFYDIPSGLDLERIKFIKAKDGGTFYDVTRGIELEDYNIHDSTASTPERSSPVLKWDFQFTGSATQIEAWPIPDDNNQTLYIEGLHAVPTLVNDDDVCLLESELIVLYAAAELLKSVDAKDAEAKRALAEEFLRIYNLRVDSGGSTPVQIGLDSPTDDAKSGRAVVRISS